jgi:hypothetical protein
MNKKAFNTTVVTLFFLAGMLSVVWLSVVWLSVGPAFAQTINSNNQTTATGIDQLTSNLTAARDL